MNNFTIVADIATRLGVSLDWINETFDMEGLDYMLEDHGSDYVMAVIDYYRQGITEEVKTFHYMSGYSTEVHFSDGRMATLTQYNSTLGESVRIANTRLQQTPIELIWKAAN